MYRIILIIPLVVGSYHDPSAQLEAFKEKTKTPIGFITTSNGAVVDNKDASSTLNKRLLFNEFFLESITHLSRERIPERVVHANGAGAFGYFEVTHDITHICKAKLFASIGKKTPIAVRFSSIAAERGASDLSRDGRGFAIKFYTEEGNFDIVGLNQPVFPVKDPLVFPTFVHSMKRNPATGLLDENSKWDFLTLRPEAWNNFIRVFSDRGIPDGFGYMNGFGVHTFQVSNGSGTPFFVRFHFTADAGEKYLTSEQANEIQSKDMDYERRNLYKSILNGNYPSWQFGMQILSLEDVRNAGTNVFDVTRYLPLDQYPVHPVGRFVLDKNPENYFAEIEQLAFNPAHLVPGIQGGLDKLFEARRFSYRDAINYRLGVNFNNIRVNCPFNTKPLTYYRDGRPPVEDNQNSYPNYHPNSFNGAIPHMDTENIDLLQVIESEPNNVDQVREFYLNELSDAGRDRLIDNILSSLSQTAEFLQKRAISIFDTINEDFGYRIKQCLKSNSTTHQN